MWSTSQPSRVDWPTGKVVPEEVLYAYDGPLTFITTIGLARYVFHKVDEGHSGDLFLAVGATDEIIEAIKRGALSMRGALLQRKVWIVELTDAFAVTRYWQLPANDVPTDYIPAAGLTILPSRRFAPDSVEQANSFFSMRFLGSELSTSAIPFRTFKTLVDNAYESIRSIFQGPEIDGQSINNYFDLNILEPKFGSLIIAVDGPVVDRAGMERKKLPSVSDGLIREAMESDRNRFFESMNQIVDKAGQGPIARTFALDHVETLEQVFELVPSKANQLDQIEFRTAGFDESEVLAINSAVGNRIRDAYRLIETERRTVRGTIIEVNAASSTFVIVDLTHRQITCSVSRKEFKQLHPDIGDRLTVVGDYQERERRDFMKVRAVEAVEKVGRE